MKSYLIVQGSYFTDLSVLPVVSTLRCLERRTELSNPLAEMTDRLIQNRCSAGCRRCNSNKRFQTLYIFVSPREVSTLAQDTSRLSPFRRSAGRKFSKISHFGKAFTR